jgi:conjugative relaxase-like TrwC/TraI family protein
MLRVRTIYARSALAAVDYYSRYLTEAPSEIPGRWTGAQAAGLGLAGDVGADDLLAILEGRDPRSGTPLGRALVDRELANGKIVKAVAGFDATFSAPKSLSVLWALTRDHRLLEAHDVAVNAALSNVDRYGSTTRVRVAGGRRLHPDSQGLTIAAFRQTTSRADDPQIHTHCVISAKVQTEDGRWLALDARYLKKHQRMLGGLYQSVLRNELTHRFGISWGDIEKGQAEMSAMPDDLLTVFSKRSDQIDDALAAKIDDFVVRQGRDPNQWELGAIKREAAVDTRAHKSGNGVPDLTTRWDREAADVGWTAHDLIDALQAQRVDPAERPPSISVDSLIDALSTTGSSWNRAQIVGALADLARPDPSLSGEEWAGRIEASADAVASRCVELDPEETNAATRASDGRSMWHEPISPHITTEAILAEEEFIASWALAAQAHEPRPSLTVTAGQLDVLQADVAAAVAGDDLLVLVVGPAGAGKTTTLRAAIDDLNRAGRPVFGVAPSAKAARVLERETGAESDTLAKLIHEWHRTDRPPLDRYWLPAGSTVIVDEAGMVGTSSLAALTRLVTERDWRLALVGDPHQLQAVGRGGMFHELCTTGRVHELARIHRFTEPWEAAASLQLRHGDPRALDAYLAHDRIKAGPLDEQLAFVVDQWRAVAAERGICAITASSNDHVDAINAAIQISRVAAGDIDAARSAPIGGKEHAYVGDVVVTRRNDRRLTTTAGEPVRNRETWTVTGIDDGGAITVSSNGGAGSVALPADYTREHVRLGYAATEHGNQGDTTAVGMELVSEATTRRGLYVGATRGQQENLMIVITESHDLDEALDILERVLANERADLPAIAQRRALAETAFPAVERSRPQPEPRCEIPAWVDELMASIGDDLRRAEDTISHFDEERDATTTQLREAKQRRLDAERLLDPHRPALEAAHQEVEVTQRRVWSSNSQFDRSKGLKRRRARHEVAAAKDALNAATERQQQAEAVALPARESISAADREVRDLTRRLSGLDVRRRMALGYVDIEELRDFRDALHQWRRWADGHQVSADTVVQVLELLSDQRTSIGTDVEELASPLAAWAIRHGIQTELAVRPVGIERGPDLGIGL